MSIRRLPRKWIERVVAHYGYELKEVGAPPCGYDTFLARVRASGFRPRTVFDVGVGHGTPWLYNGFPGSHFVLLEPQREFSESMERICYRIDAEYHLVGVGRCKQQLPLYRLLNSSTGSSFLKPNAHTDQAWGKSERSHDYMQIVPLDDYADRPGPYFLKIDTEGYELEVLRGAQKVLDQTDVVLLEVAFTPRQDGEPDLCDIGAFMRSRGFRLIDFPNLVQKSTHGSLVYGDVAFARIGSAVT